MVRTTSPTPLSPSPPVVGRHEYSDHEGPLPPVHPDGLPNLVLIRGTGVSRRTHRCPCGSTVTRPLGTSTLSQDQCVSSLGSGLSASDVDPSVPLRVPLPPSKFEHETRIGLPNPWSPGRG